MMRRAAQLLASLRRVQPALAARSSSSCWCQALPAAAQLARPLIDQPGIDYGAWARQAQARRCYGSPVRAAHATMDEVADRKLREAHAAYQQLQEKMEGTNPGSEACQRLAKESASLAPLAEGYEQLQALQAEVSGLEELLAGEGDRELRSMAEEERAALSTQIEELRSSLLLALLPADAADAGGCVLEVRASVGGDWAGNFAADLLAMYRRYAASAGWRFELLESRPTELGGVKSATVMVTGPGAFGRLRWESGVHRATMVPPNDKHGRVQTGTAVVVALPEASEVSVEIDDSDLRIETCRASGKGGQHVNTTDSAVRIVHLPTGIAVTCQNERSQLQNKAQAMRVLRAKLAEAEAAKAAAALSAQRRAAAGSANANERIRSYYYNDARVADHRLGASLSIDVERFMGDPDRLDKLISGVALAAQQEALAEMLAGGDG